MKQRYTVSDAIEAERSLNPETTSLSMGELNVLAEKQQTLFKEFEKCLRNGMDLGLGMFPSERHLINHVVNALPRSGMENYKNDKIALYFGAQVVCSFIHSQQMPYRNYYGYDISYYATYQAGADLMNKIAFFWDPDED